MSTVLLVVLVDLAAHGRAQLPELALLLRATRKRQGPPGAIIA
jgi:hypothetical protein